MADSPLIYLVLGAPDSDRRELTIDLIRDGIEKDARPLLLISDRENNSSELKKPEQLTIGTWTWEEGQPLNLTIPDEFTHVFLISESRGSPIDQIEAFANWLPKQKIELGRIITIVNAELVFTNKELMRWYEACIHFSDVVLINRRENIPPKWMAEFIDYFKKENLYPCHFELVKKGRIKNPALILEPEPRRISLIFDELPTLEEHEMGDDDPEEEDEEEGDIYLQLLPSGRRKRQIPDIRKYIRSDTTGSEPA